MDQPGIEVRPIINIAGRHEFNEVFFTDARTAKENVVGEVGNGWAVTNTLLGFERGGRSTCCRITYREELDRLLEVARERGATADPLIRQRLACVPRQGGDHALPRHALAVLGAGREPARDRSRRC